MTTSITVIGTIATDPKLITPAAGTILCSFRLASDERRYDREKKEWIEGNTNWFGVVAFRTIAAHAHESFHKGDRVIVSGRLRMRSWEKEERRGISVEIEADAIGHDVRWGISKFEKRVGARGDTEAQDASQAPADTQPAETAEPPVPADADSEQATPADIGWAPAAA